eukprot:2529635-Prymnesium_polylepis.1
MMQRETTSPPGRSGAEVHAQRPHLRRRHARKGVGAAECRVRCTGPGCFVRLSARAVRGPQAGCYAAAADRDRRARARALAGLARVCGGLRRACSLPRGDQPHAWLRHPASRRAALPDPLQVAVDRDHRAAHTRPTALSAAPSAIVRDRAAHRRLVPVRGLQPARADGRAAVAEDGRSHRGPRC